MHIDPIDRAEAMGAQGVLYWTGNAAKCRIMAQILADPRPQLTVFDYGAGRGGDWPGILRWRKGLDVVCFEPYEPDADALRRALAGCPGRVLTRAEFEAADFKADYIVSFSVLEHVFDRGAYLRHAKQLLAPDGVFHLNYDDGHFRTSLDLDEARGWKLNIAETLQNRLAWLWPRTRRIGLYQSRVYKAAIDAMIADCGFRIAAERYENLASLKSIAKTVPPARTQEFTRFWLEVEETLNTRFRFEAEERRGDRANLWREMGSRTLTLHHA